MKIFLPPARLRYCIRLVAAVLSALFLEAWATSANAVGLECPETGQGAPELTSIPAGAKLVIGGTGPDLANEISDLINQVQLKQPNISNLDLTNGLIAAYCPLVAQAAGVDRCAAMEPDASICSGGSATARRKQSAEGIDDHCRCTAAARGLPAAKKPS